MRTQSGDDDLRAASAHFADHGWLATASACPSPERSWEACTACEACNAVCPLAAQTNAVVFSGPMEIPLRLYRRFPDLIAARQMLAVFERCGPCRACEEACPQGVPILGLVASLREVLAANTSLLPEPSPTDDDRPGGDGPAGPG